MKKILLLDNNHPLLKQKLTVAGFVCDENFTASKQEIEAILPNYIGIVIRSRFKIDKPFIDQGINLEFIARVGAGLESIDTAYASKKGIALIAAPEGNRNAVGEHTLGLILSLFNHLNLADRQIREGKWLRENNRGIELDGRTVGIIGYGNMGKAFAKKLQGFDVEVLCYDIKPHVDDAFAKQVSLNEFQQKVDLISIHTPHNEVSYQMINTPFLNGFAKPIYVFNTGRGTAIVTDDLVKALKNGNVLGAGLDVLEYEKTSFENLFENDTLPEAFNYLIQADNVLLSPHVAGWTVESKIKLAETISNKILKQYNIA